MRGEEKKGVGRARPGKRPDGIMTLCAVLALGGVGLIIDTKKE